MAKITKLKCINILALILLGMLIILIFIYIHVDKVNEVVVTPSKIHDKKINVIVQKEMGYRINVVNNTISGKNVSEEIKSDWKINYKLKVYIPIINHSIKGIEYQGDLNDFDQYKMFEVHKDKALKQSFIEASNNKVKFLEHFLAQEKVKGISEEQMAFAKEKIQYLKTLNKKLVKEITLNQY